MTKGKIGRAGTGQTECVVLVTSGAHVRFFLLQSFADARAEAARLIEVAVTADPDDELFGEEAAKAAVGFLRKKPPRRIVVVASSEDLHGLRSPLARYANMHPRIRVVEVDRDLGWMDPDLLHDTLATAGALPGRGVTRLIDPRHSEASRDDAETRQTRERRMTMLPQPPFNGGK